MNNPSIYIFWIPFNTPSSKNNRVWTGGYFVVSKSTKKWRDATVQAWLDQRDRFLSIIEKLPRPYYIEFTFIRRTKQTFDYHNIVQAPLDEMTKYGWINDDNADNVKPYFGDYEYDKVNPGLRIKILLKKPKHQEDDLPQHY